MVFSHVRVWCILDHAWAMLPRAYCLFQNAYGYDMAPHCLDVEPTSVLRGEARSFVVIPGLGQSTQAPLGPGEAPSSTPDAMTVVSLFAPCMSSLRNQHIANPFARNHQESVSRNEAPPFVAIEPLLLQAAGSHRWGPLGAPLWASFV